MANKTPFDAALEGVEGVPSDLDPNKVLTYDNGKIIPREWLEGETPDAVLDRALSRTPEEEYEFLLMAGMGRDPMIEANLDMDKVNLDLDQPA